MGVWMWRCVVWSNNLVEIYLYSIVLLYILLMVRLYTMFLFLFLFLLTVFALFTVYCIDHLAFCLSLLPDILFTFINDVFLFCSYDCNFNLFILFDRVFFFGVLALHDCYVQRVYTSCTSSY
jgi:hypothetical protein